MSDPLNGSPEPRPSELPTESASAHSVEGQEIGPYRLLQRLGEGGMGEVWLASQSAPVRRKVAVKIIKRGMDTSQVVARFEVERQALAIMDHPCVAKVLDAGSTPRGRPYFVMEYVRGVPISEYCDRHKLTTRERLRLFVQVCEGVQHAHQKAIIHRDLKPSNVLVTLQDGKPLPKIIDFGVAKATAHRLTEKTLFTELGVLIGTPEYMSPEQADLTSQDIDTRTDVYALGVVLYELLVGALPFDSEALRRAGFDGIRRTIREDEPRRPSTRLSSLGNEASTESARRRRVDVATLRRQLSGDLDWITMKALEKDRARRYGSPSEMAADIDRHLQDQPVLARSPSAAYRTRKFVRRHRIGVVAAAAALFVLTGFAAAMAWQAGRIARERDRANREAQTANRALEFLTELFEVSDPSEARGNTITAREILDRGAERVEAELSNEPEIQARLMETMGMVYRKLGLYEPASPLLERSLGLRRELLGSEHPDTLQSVNDVGVLLWAQGRLEEAEEYFREAVDGRRRTLGADHPDTLQSVNDMGAILVSEGRLDESVPYFREALEGYRRVRGNDDPETLRSVNNMGFLLRAQGNLEEAETHYREALEGRRKVLGDDHPHTLTSMNNTGSLLQMQGKLEEADGYFREALERRRHVLGEEHRETLVSIHNMGFLLQTQGKLAEAEPYIREALEGRRRALGGDHPDTLQSMATLGELYTSQGRLDEAQRLLADAVAGARDVLPPRHRVTGKSLDAYGSCLIRLGRFSEAEEALLEAYGILEAVDAKLARDTAEDLARLYESWNKPDESARWRERSSG